MLSKYSGKILPIVFSVLVFIILPFINTDSTLDPELAPRFFAVSVFVLICSVAFLFNSKMTIKINTNTRKVFILMMLIQIWMAISMIQSINPGDAFSEWIRHSVLICFFLIAYVVFKSQSEPLKIISRANAIAVIIFSVFGIIQVCNQYEVFLESKLLNFNISFASTLSNKNFFSDVLLLMLPFLIHGLINENKLVKLFMILALVLDLAFIILLQSIAVWLALGISVLFFIIMAIRMKIPLLNFRISGKLRIVIVVSSAFILIGGFIIYSHTPNYKWFRNKAKWVVEYVADPMLLTKSSEDNNNSVFERLIIWRNSLHMVADHPLIGAGLNNWKILNPSYGVGGTLFTNSGMINYEHPHNDYLLIIAEQGPLGLFLYLMLLIVILRTGIRKIRNADKVTQRILLLLLCGAISFAIVSLFSYPRSRIFPMLILMIDFALILSIQADDDEKNILLRPFVFIMVFVSIFASIASAYRVSGEVHTKNAIIAQLRKNFPRMFREAEKAYSWYYPIDLTNTPVSWYKGMAMFYSTKITSAIHEYESAIQVNPYHLRVLNDLATSYEQNGERQKAIYYYRRALDETPLFLEANLNISAAYYNSGNIDSAYYFIDRIYGRFNATENRNYTIFLDAILYAKASNVLKNNSDSALNAKLGPLVSDKKLLKELYDESKKDKQLFENYLINSKKVIGK